MRKASGIMQMRQTRQMQINEDACIRNWMDKLTSREYHSLYAATSWLRDQTALSKDFVAVCGLRKMVRLNQKSWSVRQKVLGAKIHETEGLFEQNIALTHAQWQWDVENYNWYFPLGKPKKRKRRTFQNGARIEIASFSEWLANMKCCAQRKARK